MNDLVHEIRSVGASTIDEIRTPRLKPPKTQEEETRLSTDATNVDRIASRRDRGTPDPVEVTLEARGPHNRTDSSLRQIERCDLLARASIALGPGIRRITAQLILLNVTIDALHEAPVDFLPLGKAGREILGEMQP